MHSVTTQFANDCSDVPGLLGRGSAGTVCVGVVASA